MNFENPVTEGDLWSSLLRPEETEIKIHFYLHKKLKGNFVIYYRRSKGNVKDNECQMYGINSL